MSLLQKRREARAAAAPSLQRCAPGCSAVPAVRERLQRRPCSDARQAAAPSPQCGEGETQRGTRCSWSGARLVQQCHLLEGWSAANTTRTALQVVTLTCCEDGSALVTLSPCRDGAVAPLSQQGRCCSLSLAAGTALSL